MERRSILKWLFGFFGALWTGGFLGVVAGYLKPPKELSSMEASMLRVGPLDQLEVGKAHFVAHAAHPLWVLRLGVDQLVALSAICTHFHCILKWQDEARVFQCPCHNGAFDQNGNVLAGPPPAPLPKFRVYIRRGDVYVSL